MIDLSLFWYSDITFRSSVEKYFFVYSVLTAAKVTLTV